MKAIDIMDQYQKGYVYFVQAGIFGPIKVGFTTNFKKRLPHLQTGCPAKLKVLGVIKTNKKTEEEYHECSRDANIHGEWFHPTEKLLRMINNAIQDEKESVYYNPDDPDQWEGMNKKQWDSWLKYKEKESGNRIK